MKINYKQGQYNSIIIVKLLKEHKSIEIILLCGIWIITDNKTMQSMTWNPDANLTP